ncbi:MAG: DEAD/DEAH box helicase family protein [Arhodomonas sp.]|nr:DEAD/DEAH box helicase family protein [Arhodomonas sp.]
MTGNRFLPPPTRSSRKPWPPCARPARRATGAAWWSWPPASARPSWPPSTRKQIRATRVLFVAHREEILLQAEETFQRVLPQASGSATTAGSRKTSDVELLFASVQTLGKGRHLEAFAPGHFDYIVVDEFHHAAASTYRRLARSTFTRLSCWD